MTVRQRLIWLVAASVGPLFLLAGLLLWQSYDRERSSIEQRLRESASSLAQVVDLDLGRARALLRGLATSDHLGSGDLAAFHAQSSEAVADMPGWVALFDREARFLVTTRVPFGAPLPAGPVPAVTEVIERQRAGTSNVMFSPYLRATIFATAIPILSGGEVRYVLTLVSETRTLARLLGAQTVPADWSLALVDRAGVIIARAPGHDVLAGRPISDALRAGVVGDGQIVRTEDQDGVRVLAAFANSVESGWSVVVSGPLDPYLLGIWRSIGLFAAAVAGAALLAAALIYCIARSISQPIEQLGFGARALGAGRTFGPVPTTLREVADVSRTLIAASERIRTQTEQREELLHDLSAERGRLAAVLDNLPLAVVIAEAPSGRIFLANQFAVDALGSGDDDIVPRTVAEYGHFKGFRPDGRPLQATDWPLARAVLHGETVRNEEVVFERRDGTRLITSMSAAPIRDAGRVVAGVVVIDDITERRAGEQRQSMLAAEVDHRAKNLLAIVQVLLRQTRAESAAEYAAAAQGRVAALARAHALLSASRWHGADLRRLVEEEVTAFRGRHPERLRCTGPPIEVTAEAAQSLAMALHELATNAAKHGCLTRPEGRVEISWRFDSRSGLEMTWIETGGPATCPPAHQGLGTAVLEQTIRRQLKGEIVCAWLQSGLHCTFRIPADQLQPREVRRA